MKEKKEMNGAEAVFGFAAWLTCRSEETVFGASHDCACIANLARDFCKENKLTDPRRGWECNLTHPD